jgi:hypothetical protein
MDHTDAVPHPSDYVSPKGQKLTLAVESLLHLSVRPPLRAAPAIDVGRPRPFQGVLTPHGTKVLNLNTAAESRIRDANIAEEAATLTRLNILNQAGIAALSQANQRASSVLSLLRG